MINLPVSVIKYRSFVCPLSSVVGSDIGFRKCAPWRIAQENAYGDEIPKEESDFIRVRIKSNSESKQNP